MLPASLLPCSAELGDHRDPPRFRMTLAFWSAALLRRFGRRVKAAGQAALLPNHDPNLHPFPERVGDHRAPSRTICASPSRRDERN